MAFDWSVIFDSFGIKRVTETDKNRSAYVLNKAQRNALLAAGHIPSKSKTTSTIAIDILFDPTTTTVTASHYNSMREGSGRTPETRMGQALIHWVDVGDHIVIGSRGKRVMAARVSALPADVSELGRTLALRGSRKQIFAKARRVSGAPPRRTRTVQDFVRDPYVIAAVLIRAAGNCEMPGCTQILFKRGDGTNFLEVHHVTPLAEGGDDTLTNAAALCPSCHRELHFGQKRVQKKAKLVKYIATLPAP